MTIVLNSGYRKEWICVKYDSGKLICSIPDSQSHYDEIVDPQENYLYSLRILVHLFQSASPSLKGIAIESIPKVPHDIFASFREFMLSFSVPMIGGYCGAAPASPVRVVELSKPGDTIVQFRYEDGPLDQAPILKYGWFHEKFIHVHPTDDGEFALYTKRSVCNEADIFFLRIQETKPEAYLDMGKINLTQFGDPVAALDKMKHRLDKIQKNQIALLEIQYYEQTIKFAVPPAPGAVWGTLGNWIGQGYSLNNQRRGGLKQGPS